jgi:hypothetical protein
LVDWILFIPLVSISILPGGLSSNEERALDNFVLIEEVFDQELEVVLMRGYFLLGNQGILTAQIPKIIPSIKKNQQF